MLEIYRPSPNSAMRSFGRPFNLPSVEALIVGIYQIVDPIDASSPPGATAPHTASLHVEPIEVIGAPLQVQWFIDGLPVDTTPDPTTLHLSTITLAPGPHFVMARVTDTNPFVMSDGLAEEWLTDVRSWSVTVPAAAPAKGGATIESLARVLRSFGAKGEMLDGDLDGDGSVGLPDLLEALGAGE
jgi:hypothetical protein